MFGNSARSITYNSFGCGGGKVVLFFVWHNLQFFIYNLQLCNKEFQKYPSLVFLLYKDK